MSAKKIIGLFVFLCFKCVIAFATHNRAGEITIIQIDDHTIRAIINTYTKASSVAADRDSLTVVWGDGTQSTIPRNNGNGEILANNTKKNIYISEHTYPGRGNYTVSVMDPNRVENILNVDPPNSVNIPFFIQTTFTLLNLQFQSPNNTVVLLKAPIDFACVGVPFQHNPAAFDADGDSLSFELTVPLMDKNLPVPNYSYPSQISPGINNVIALDSKRGTFNWISPQKAGEYNIAFIIHEYRKGVLIASTIRDMQIYVRDDCGPNRPPEIQSIDDTCVVAGTVLNIPILARDPDTTELGSKIMLSAAGSVFSNPIPAVFIKPNGFQKSPVSAALQWQTDCNHIQKEFYSIVVTATDNMLDTTGLSTLHTIRIKVTGPAPDNLKSTIVTKGILLDWNKPYSCDTSLTLFRGFSVWRKEGSLDLQHDTCTPGLDGSDYSQIAYLVNESLNDKYIYLDSTAVKGKLYCYRVQAEFAKLSPKGFPVNPVSSLFSNESCNALAIESPILLNVDVEKTNTVTGEIKVRYTKPDVQVYDTLKMPAPYIVRYFVNDQSGWTEIQTAKREYLSFAALWDTIFLHSGINTSEIQYRYYINIESSNGIQHSSDTAESVFLISEASDQLIRYQWNSITPWNNFKYVIYNFNPITMAFDSIGQTIQTSYTLTGLKNGTEYCSYILAHGKYGLNTIESPLLNKSNLSCNIPVDNIPPCCPNLSIDDPCSEIQVPNPEEFTNKLNWNNPNLTCQYNDAVSYRIYAYYGGKEILVTQIDQIGQTSFDHLLRDSIPECYRITSLDKNNNECLGDTVCVDYCPYYTLPNTFTPNGDGHNDVFKPYPFRFVDQINFIVFNRWGNVVFKTTNPGIFWDGNDLEGNVLPDGTYFYNCDLKYSGLINFVNVPNKLSGFIELRSGKP